MATNKDYRKFAVKYNKEFKIAGVHKMKKNDLINAIEERLSKSRKEIRDEYKQLKNIVIVKKTPVKKEPVKKEPVKKEPVKKEQPKRDIKEKINNTFDEKNDLQRKNKITNSLPESKNKKLNDKILKQIKENSSFDSILNLLLKTDYYVLNRTNGRIKIDNTKFSFNPNMIIYQVGRKTKKIYSEEKQKEKDLEGEKNNRKIIEMMKEQPKK